jgi:organic radical activating enzyme
MSRYYIEYPIPIRCGLKCRYCFHAEKWELEAAGKADSKYTETCPFTVDDFIKWRDKHLSDGTEFIYELHGGEMSFESNHGLVFELLTKLDGKFQLQTNGLGDYSFYEELTKYKDKIDRIGFTYHRQILKDGILPLEPISNVPYLFINNVDLIHGRGIKTYVKELLFLEDKSAILKHKKYWWDRDVEFRIQDFKGYRGRDFSTMITYTAEDWALIDSEYRHESNTCSCRDGYKQILIRGYDIFAGDVINCWNDPTVTGNILNDTYTPYQQVNILNNGERDVAVQKKVYRGSYPYDFWHPDIEKEFKSLSKGQLNNTIYQEVIMKARLQERLNGLNVNQQNVNAEALQLQQVIRDCEKRLTELNTEGIRFAAQAEILSEVIQMANSQETAEPVAVEAVGAV